MELTSILYEVIDKGYFSCNIRIKPEKESLGFDILITSIPWEEIIQNVPWDSIKTVSEDIIKQIVVKTSINILEKSCKRLVK
jgi:hypothetical protein